MLDNGSAIGVLDLQALNEMTQRGKSSGGEGARGLLSQGDTQTFEDDGLGSVGDAVVLDVRLEIVQLGELRIRGGRRAFERRQQCLRLLVHGGARPKSHEESSVKSRESRSVGASGIVQVAWQTKALQIDGSGVAVVVSPLRA